MKISPFGRRAAAALGAAVVLAPAAAYAAPNLEAEFAAMDADANGYLTATEYKAPGPVLPDSSAARRDIKGPDGIVMTAPDGKPLRLRFVRDGETSVAAEGEVVLTSSQLRQYTFNRLDTDGDERLSFTEYRAIRIRGVRFRFDQSDVDFDERLTRNEYIAGETPSFSTRNTASYTEAMKASLERSRKAVVERAEAKFKALDADNDGFLTRAEMTPS